MTFPISSPATATAIALVAGALAWSLPAVTASAQQAQPAAEQPAAAQPVVGGSMSLQDAVKLTVETHPDISAGRNNSEATKEEERQAWAGYLPTVDGRIAGGWEVSNNATTRGRDQRRRGGGDREVGLFRKEGSMTVRENIFNGLATYYEVKRQEWRVKSAGERLTETGEVTGLDAVNAYIEVLRARELVRLADENLRFHGEIRNQIRELAEGGGGREVDLQQANGRYALADATLRQRQGDLRQAEARFVQVVGQFPPELSRPGMPAGMPANAEDVLAQAAEGNPSIRIALADVEVARSAWDGAYAHWFPTLDAELTATRNHSLDGTEGINADQQAMLVMRYRFINGGADVSNQREAAARLREAQDVLNRSRRDAEETARRSWNAFVTARDRLDSLTQHVTSSDNVRSAYKDQFLLGQRSLLDVLDSENEHFSARSSLTSGEYDMLSGAFQVLAATGKLLGNFGVATPAPRPAGWWPAALGG